ncbi:MAG TPA: hypothetical protein VLZ77_13245 [Acidimicrobiales bacterium]|nr:hypothetical protein [Acidimicrobiales bacterium]
MKAATQQTARRVVRAGVGALGLPLAMVERTTRRVGIDVRTSYPARFLEGWHADVARVAGQITGDADLTERGRRQRARVESLRRAAMLSRQAAEEDAAASEHLRAHVRGADRQHRAIDAAGRALERELVAQQAVSRAAAGIAARRDEAAVDRRDAQRHAVERQAERAARRTRVAEESAAVDGERAAVESEAQAAALAAAADRHEQAERAGP